VKEFGKGFASGVKGAVKFAGKVKKIVSEEELGEAKKKPSVHDDYYDPMEDPEFDPHEAEATRGQSGRGTAGKMNVRKKYPVKEGEVIDESRLVKKLTRPIRKAKRIGKRVLDTFDSDPGRAHTIGTLGNPSVKNDDKRAAERKAGKKKVSEGYAKPNTTVPKGSKVGSGGVGLRKKELKDLSTAARTLKGSNVAKADKIADDFNVQALIDSGKFTSQEINAIVEAERSLGDRLHRKRKLYDKTTKKAMQFARDEGEASGHARYRMSSISREMDGIKAKMKKEG
jgi:hypothetical protein